MYQNKYKTLVNFKTNLNQPRHSWFDVKEGYSTVLVNNILSDLKINKNDGYIMDPFSGSGTTVLGLTLGSMVAPIASAIGTSMLIDGVTSIIAPTPQQSNLAAADSLSDNDPNVQANFGFNSITNTSRAGVPVPIIYGQVFTG